MKANIIGKKPRSSAQCAWKGCTRRAYFDRQPLAIRCGYCLRIYCRLHAHRHFGTENVQQQARTIARMIIATLEKQ